jgi:DNA-binding response OmpR family regulator
MAHAPERLVLLAEDDPDIALILTEALEAEGYTVVHARNGKQALQLLDATAPRLLVTDLMMPEMDGLALLRALGERSEPPLPVLAMSAFDTYLSAAVELGADASLAKPFALDSFLRHVGALSDGGASEPAPPRAPDDEQRRLLDIVTMQLDEPSPTAAMDQFALRTARIFDVPVCLVSIITRDRQCWHAHCGLPPDLAEARGTPREDSFCTHAVAARAALVVTDTVDNPFFAKNRLVRERGLRFYAGVPLLHRDEEALGTLCLLDFAPRPFTMFDLELLGVLGRRVLAELEWRERRNRPGEPLSTFRHLAWLDEELDVLGREAFEQALHAEAMRAAEQRRGVALVVSAVERGELEATTERLKAEFPRALLGRLALSRVGVLVPGLAAADAVARARGAAGPAAVVEGVDVPRMSGGADVFLRAAEHALS